MSGSEPRTLCVKVFTTTGDPVIEEYPDLGYRTEGDLLRLWREKLAEPLVTMVDRDSRVHLIPTAHIVKVIIASPEGDSPIRGELPESDGAIPVLGTADGANDHELVGEDKNDPEQRRGPDDAEPFDDEAVAQDSGIRPMPSGTFLEELRRHAPIRGAERSPGLDGAEPRGAVIAGPGAGTRKAGKLLG